MNAVDVVQQEQVPYACLFLSGDVMTGRGIDAILPHAGNPQLYENFCHSARDYVRLAEQANGALPASIGDAYPWGDALAVLERMQPHIRLINLETAVTASADYWPNKAVLYRMHPDNIGCLTSARVDCCVLANNHTLDWGRQGLDDTLATLRGAGIQAAGAGKDQAQAAAPAVLTLASGLRVRVYAFGAPTSGVPASWAATAHRSGVNYVPEITVSRAEMIGRRMAAERGPGELVVVSLHWGSNWGFDVGDDERAFAHALIDTGGVDIVHGHSSHHVRGVELYRGKLVLYGCGDLLNDYEGIAGEEHYRPDLALMYFVCVEGSNGTLIELQAVPMQIRQMQLRCAPAQGAAWLHTTLARESERLGTRVEQGADGVLLVRG
ncbi:CapA family protein [Trinickia fusca]|uniref:CapA family protein n=1 Tax=Trinickia fusca TaxID=2419777 RepID=A0A494XET4_9BURK|nr:CapA family protein [Trinickia fusca]RKP46986.1 CapA family protein [Trinickia fusca]